jgi:hypothetical protein
MTPEQINILNTLFQQSPELFCECEIIFLVLVSRYLRYALLSRPECLAIEYILEHVCGEDPTENPGIVDNFCGYDITPITSSGTLETGGVGGIRPSGCGDGLNPFDMEMDFIRYLPIMEDESECTPE